MSSYFETIIDAKTGAKTVRQFTQQEIDAIKAKVKPSKLAALANYRWQRETGGMTFAGFPVATDEVSQTKIIGAVVGAQMDPTATINWKMADGTFVELTASDIIAIGTAMRAHVQACFDREAVLRAQIEAMTDADAIEALDITTGWPA